MKSLVNVRIAEAGTTKREVSQRAGVGRTQLWKYSTDEGIERATMPALVRIAQAIGCGVKDLFEE